MVHVPDWCFFELSYTLIFAIFCIVQVHHGFYSAYHNTTIRPGILNAVERAKDIYGDLKIVVTGHSMGGAMAAFCGLDLTVIINMHCFVARFSRLHYYCFFFFLFLKWLWGSSDCWMNLNYVAYCIWYFGIFFLPRHLLIFQVLLKKYLFISRLILEPRMFRLWLLDNLVLAMQHLQVTTFSLSQIQSESQMNMTSCLIYLHTTLISHKRHTTTSQER